MFYLSKGVIYKASLKGDVHVSRCGDEYNLQDGQAKAWLKGRFCVAYAANTEQQSAVRALESIGLTEVVESEENACYRLLSNCVICRANTKAGRLMLNKDERVIWEWVKNAGFKLTISEFVCLAEKSIVPGPSFYGEDNWSALIHAIYTPETIFDRILVAKMEDSPARDSVVSALLGLLRKKRIILL